MERERERVDTCSSRKQTPDLMLISTSCILLYYNGIQGGPALLVSRVALCENWIKHLSQQIKKKRKMEKEMV